MKGLLSKGRMALAVCVAVVALCVCAFPAFATGTIDFSAVNTTLTGAGADLMTMVGVVAAVAIPVSLLGFGIKYAIHIFKSVAR